MIVFEKAVLTSAYSIRKLAESFKLSDQTRSEPVPVVKYLAKGKQVSLINWWAYWELYDMGAGNYETLSLWKLCSQLIHSFAFLVKAENEKDAPLSFILFNSDFDKNKHLYQLRITDLVDAIRLVGKEYPSSMSMKYDPEIKDWRTEINR